MPTAHELAFLAPIPRGTVQSATEGVCASALLSTKHWGGDRHDVKTMLLIEPATAPYR